MKTAGKLSLIWATHLSKKIVILCLLLFVAMPLDAQEAGFAALSKTPYFGCATCHGWAAEGSPAHQAPAIAGLDTDYLLTQMNAYASGQRGAHAQDHYGAQMALIARAYPESMRQQLAALIAALPPVDGIESKSVKGDIERGKTLYSACASCHGSVAEGNATLRAPALNRFSQTYLQHQLNNYKNDIRGRSESSNDDQAMRALVQSIIPKSSQIDDIVAYIASISSEK